MGEHMPHLNAFQMRWLVKLCDQLLIYATPERFSNELLMIKRYANPRITLFHFILLEYVLHLYAESLFISPHSHSSEPPIHISQLVLRVKVIKD